MEVILMAETLITMSDIDPIFDDAYFDFESITFNKTVLVAKGWRLGYWRRWRAKFPMHFTFTEVSDWRTEDPERLSGLTVDTATYIESEGAFEVTGPIPGK